MTGKTIVVTGSLKSMKRDEFRDFIIKNGGRLASSVSKNTDYLVCGENPGSKLTRAEELGVELIEEDDFFKRFGN